MIEAVAPKPARPCAEPIAPQVRGSVRLSPSLRWQLTLGAADLVTVFLAASLTYAIYVVSGVGRGHYDPAGYLRLGVLFAGIAVFALHGHGAYRDEVGLMRIDAVQKILRAVLTGMLLTLGLSFLARLPSFSRITLLMVGPATALALVLQRWLIWKLRDQTRAAQPGARHALIYGAGETGQLLARHLLTEHQLGLVPVGFLDDDSRLHGREVRVGAGVHGEQLPVFGKEEMLRAAVEMTGAEAVFLATPSAPIERIQHLLSRVEDLGVPVFFVPSAGDLLLSSLRFGQVAGIPIFTRRQASNPRFYGVLKRGMDVLGSIALLALTLPLIAIGALLIRATSAGPVLFSQRRIGLHGQPFTIYKLRTMCPSAPRYAQNPMSSVDSRVTRVGAWLRRLSIDELPQLINVLQGEMSLVGPRPEMPFVVERYDETQRQRLAVKPGLTGLWQISADRVFEIHDNIHYDLYYVERCSTMLDIAIVVMTPFALLAKNRAM